MSDSDFDERLARLIENLDEIGTLLRGHRETDWLRWVTTCRSELATYDAAAFDDVLGAFGGMGRRRQRPTGSAVPRQVVHQALPNVVEFVVVPGEGHLALMRHWRDMLRVVTQQSPALHAERPEVGS